jgi:hypothetical protein
MTNKTILALFCCFFFYYFANAQEYFQKDSTQKQNNTITLMQIKLKDGTIIKGIIKSQDQQMMKVATQNLGVVEINLQNIVSITPANEAEHYLSPNQYFISTSAFMLKPKAVELQNIYGLYNNFEFGISNNFSLSVGTIIIPTFIVIPLLFGAKVGIPISKNFGVYVSSKNIALIGVDAGFVGVITSGFTVGNPLNNFSAGLSWAYATTGNVSQKPTFSFSGSLQIGKKLSLITDNFSYAFGLFGNPNANGSILYTLGLKTLGKRNSFGFGFLGYYQNNSYFNGYFSPVPYIRANFNLTKQKGF